MQVRERNVDILLAVKPLEQAKSRLGERLPPALRRATVLAMLEDTVNVSLLVSSVRSVTVITRDDVVAATARRCGSRVFAEPRCHVHSDPLNVALCAGEAAIARGRDRGTVNIAVLQADLAALKPNELHRALDVARQLPRSFVPDQEGTGTVALFAFGTRLEPKFGNGSARRHQLSGARRLDGVWPGLRRDVDTADDLAAALRLGVGGATYAAVLKYSGLVSTI